MKIAAHPLVVAAAMGWLGPAALPDDSEIEGLAAVQESVPAPEVERSDAELAVAEAAYFAARDLSVI